MWPFNKCAARSMKKKDFEEMLTKIVEKSCRKCCKNQCDKGKICLASGKHEIAISTDCQPSKVFVSSSSCHQVCGANQDLYSVEVIPGGFKLTAVVVNEKLKIEWIAFCDEEKDCCDKSNGCCEQKNQSCTNPCSQK